MVVGCVDLQHRNTFVRAQRPYGVSCVLCGIDPDGVPRTYVTEPSGIYHQYKAVCVGEGQEVPHTKDEAFVEGR